MYFYLLGVQETELSTDMDGGLRRRERVNESFRSQFVKLLTTRLRRFQGVSPLLRVLQSVLQVRSSVPASITSLTSSYLINIAERNIINLIILN
jgi:hypothetical protein